MNKDVLEIKDMVGLALSNNKPNSLYLIHKNSTNNNKHPLKYPQKKALHPKRPIAF
jgi:hypothetical protein